MGGLVSVPLAALGTAVGGCFGSCVATGCCQLAASGTVSSAKAARCVLVWVQAFTIAIALLAAVTADQWLSNTCDKLDQFGITQVGICDCSSASESGCWRNQVIYRAEAAASVVFASLMLMAVSGCAADVARTHSVAKFMAVFLFGFMFLFIPNSVFDVFGSIATAAGSIFLIAQSILLIDFAYSLNEIWYGYAQVAYRRQISSTAYRIWIASMLITSALIFIGSIVGSALMFQAYDNMAGKVTNVLAAILSIVLLVVSILDWCEHGALLTSAVVMAYSTYLVCEALAVLPDGVGPEIPVWISLAICSVSLISFARGAGGFSINSAPAAAAQASSPALRSAEEGAAAEAPAVAAEVEAPDGGDSAKDVQDFIIQCAVHAAAAMFVSASLAPRVGQATFGFRIFAVFASLTLYGWSLVAPKLLSGRSFS